MGKRAQRIPSWPGVIHSNKGRIHLRRPTCDIPHFACGEAADHTFRLRRSGGPYISLAAKRRTIHFACGEAAGHTFRLRRSGGPTIRLRRSGGPYISLAAKRRTIHFACGEAADHTFRLRRSGGPYISLAAKRRTIHFACGEAADHTFRLRRSGGPYISLAAKRRTIHFACGEAADHTFRLRRSGGPYISLAAKRRTIHFACGEAADHTFRSDLMRLGRTTKHENNQTGRKSFIFSTRSWLFSEQPVTREERPGMSPNLQMFAQDCSKEDLRAICEGLFVPQRHHGIDTHRAPCRDVASECGDSDESERCEKHRLDICGLHTKKQCGHEACYAHRASHTRNDSNQSYRHAPPEDEP